MNELEENYEHDDDYIDTEKMDVSQEELEHAANLMSEAYSIKCEDILEQLEEAREQYMF